MPDLEALGDAATGAVLAGAVEPKTGRGGHTPEGNCLNCGAELAGEYCSACGQRAHVHRTLSAFFHDLLHGVLHFEGKIWHTLPLLAWRPGELTRRYIDGQRARFVSPIALFLFCVFLLFATVNVGDFLDGSKGSAAKAKLSEEVATARATVVELEGDRTEAIKAGRPTAKLDARLREARIELTALQSMKERTIDTRAVQVSDDLPVWLRNSIGKAARNPELLLYKLKTNAYKFSWALIPISVLFVWLLFPLSRRFRLYDHTVFVTYSLCFMILLLIVATLVGLALPSIATLAFFVPPIHMYRQLRGTYDLGVGRALWRTIALTVFAFIAVSLFVVLLVALGVLG